MSSVIHWVNPVLARELVKRMRGAKAMFMRSGCLGLLGLVLILVYHAGLRGGFDRRFGNTVVDWASVGQGMFEWTLMFMLLLVLFLVPGATASSIVGERQRQTLMPVQVSLMRPLSIVLGKLGASVAYILLLVVATMPLLAVAHLIGGITFLEIVKGLGVIMFIAVCTAATSLLFSAAMRSSRTATVMSYVVVMVLFILVFVVTFFMPWFFDPDSDDIPMVAGGILWSALAVNPIAALADAVGEAYSLDWFGRFNDNGPISHGTGPLSEFKSEFHSEFNLFDVASELRAIPLWVLSILIYGMLAALSVLRVVCGVESAGACQPLGPLNAVALSSVRTSRPSVRRSGCRRVSQTYGFLRRSSRSAYQAHRWVAGGEAVSEQVAGFLIAG